VKPVKQKAEAPKKDRNDVDRGSLVNLIPSEFRQSIDPRSKLLGLGLTVLGCVVVLGGTFALLTFYRTSILEKIQKLRAERATVEQSISQLRPRQREALATNNRLKIISSLLDQHIYWTKFFEKLEQYTIDDVYFTGTLSGSLDGQMTLSAVGSSYTSPARQLLVLEKASDFVTNVAITSASAVQNSSANLPPGSVAASEVSFSITITLVPDIFTYSADSFPFDRRGTASPENPSIDPLNPFGLPVGGNTQPQSGNSNTNQAIPGNTNLNPTQ
jgi:Tfp pilus assembly protein PilN